MVEKLELSVPHVPTEENVADLLTKPLAATRFIKLRAALMGHPPSPDCSVGAAARS